MNRKLKLLIYLIVLLGLIVIVLGIYWVNYLRIAHSSFENYYEFRGCQELINRTSDEGYCKTNSGDIIKIVKFNDKWYLDGDLYNGFLDW